ncbi:ARM family protein [Pelomyxa schiedti]|nr:ARM family protein [Pelomyxa schiedti]
MAKRAQNSETTYARCISQSTKLTPQELQELVYYINNPLTSHSGASAKKLYLALLGIEPAHPRSWLDLVFVGSADVARDGWTDNSAPSHKNDPYAKAVAQAVRHVISLCPGNLTLPLLEMVGDASLDCQLRIGAGIHFNRLLMDEKYGCWVKLDRDHQNLLKTKVIKLLQTEQNTSTSKYLYLTLAQIFGLCDNPTQEFLQFVMLGIKSEAVHYRIACLWVIAYFSGVCEPDNFSEISVHLPQVLRLGLLDPSPEVKYSALYAITLLVEGWFSAGVLNHVQMLLPLMLEVLTLSSWQLQADCSKKVLREFTKIASSEPDFFAPHLSEVVTAMFLVASSTLTDVLRMNAIEFLVSYAQSKPDIKRIVPSFLSSLVPFLLDQIACVKDEPTWETCFNIQEEQYSQVVSWSAQFLANLSSTFGGATIVPILLPHATTMCENASDWRQRFGGLCGVAICVEWCHKAFITSFKDIIRLCSNSLADESPRVRWASCFCLEQLGHAMPKTVVKEYMNALVYPLLDCLNDTSLRVIIKSMEAIVQMVRGTDYSTISPFIDKLMRGLLTLLPHKHPKVVEIVLPTISEIAIIAKKAFTPYCGLFPVLKNILKTSSLDSETKCASMECIGLVATSVDPEYVAKDISEILPEIVNLLHQTAFISDGHKSIFLIAALLNIAEYLTDLFLPFFDSVVAGLLSFYSSYEIEGMQKLNPKVEFWGLIKVLATKMEQNFHPYTKQVAQLAVRTLQKSSVLEEKSAAFSLFPALLHLVKITEKADLQGCTIQAVWNAFFKYLLSEMTSVQKMEELTEDFLSLDEALDEMESNHIIPQQVINFVQRFSVCLSYWHTYNLNRRDSWRRPQISEEEREKILAENEDSFMKAIAAVECLGKLGKVLSSPYIVEWESYIFPVIRSLVLPHSPSYSRSLGVYLIDDFMELEQDPVPHFDDFFAILATVEKQPNSTLRQAVAYGLGLCGIKGGGKFAVSSVKILFRIIKQPDSRGSVMATATENAISSIAKIISHQGERLDLASVVPQWLYFLPVTKDDEESKFSYGVFAELLEKSCPFLLGGNFQHLPQILHVIATFASTELVTPEIEAKVASMLHQYNLATTTTSTEIRSLVCPSRQQLSQAWLSLTDTERVNLQTLQKKIYGGSCLDFESATTPASDA